jgi:hypothetical protein
VPCDSMTHGRSGNASNVMGPTTTLSLKAPSGEEEDQIPSAGNSVHVQHELYSPADSLLCPEAPARRERQALSSFAK